MAIDLFTIGYTQSTAERFFSRLTEAGVATLIDIRVSNRSQLAGFAKMPDLAFFLEKVSGIAYRYVELLAPPLDLMRAYRAKELSYPAYAETYRGLLIERRAAEKLTPSAFDRGCLLCSEAKPDTCHRKIAAEFLTERWGEEVVIGHL